MANAKNPGGKRPHGMPTTQSIHDCVIVWLKYAEEHCPELVPLLDADPDERIEAMVEDFEDRYLGGSGTIRFPIPPKATGGVYLRYSDPNSNPRSLPQQLGICLERVVRDGVMMPWPHVFADGAITGKIAARTGYRQMKQAIEKRVCCRLYVDDSARLGRDQAEAHLFKRLLDASGCVLITIGNGIDTSQQSAALHYAISAAIDEQESRNKSHRVKRGMRDAFLQDRIVNGPCLGQRDVPLLDANGEVVINHKGRVEKQRVIDDAAAKIVREIFDRFAVKREDRTAIIADLNARNVEGGNWDDTRLRQLLKRPVYKGIEYWGMTSQVRDPETGKVTVVEHPPEEWLSRDVSHLRLVSDEVWEAAQVRLAESKSAFDSTRKNVQSGERQRAVPKRLFHLTCGCCGKPLYLGRSGKYASLCCLNGRDGKKGCTFKGYKRLSHVENSLLDHLRSEIFTKEFLERLLVEANRILDEIPESDDVELQTVKARICETEERLAELRRHLTSGEIGDIGTMVTVVREVEDTLSRLRDRERELSVKWNDDPLPMTEEFITETLDDLHGLLSKEVEAAAPILQKMLGEIIVEQREVKGSKKPQWFAKFALNGNAIVSHLTRPKDCPNSECWELPISAVWTIGEKHEVWLREVPKYEQISGRALAYKLEGRSTQWISEELGVIWKLADDAIRFAETGGRPEPEKPRKRRPRQKGSKPEPKYKSHAAEVVRLRDEKQWPFPRIARHLKIHESTATRAYDFGTHRRTRSVAVKRNRGRWQHLNPDEVAKAVSMLAAGTSVSEIAEQTSLSASTIYRLRRKQHSSRDRSEFPDNTPITV
ncbi:recombinase family protein [Thalassoroseus pseudoceratinae]|uniref:recombinase family protein n=1 Tax=Thalassoroseus pseudoceratinae TaxID=2713176 RepID=UPI00141FAD12|nr:recombinase family protein [Thalassoroseus pseudoceratinae]